MYSLSFDASAESVNRYTHVFFGQNEDPWLTQVNENIWLNKEKQTFTFDFTLLEVYSAMRLSLEFGEWDSNVRIDNVRLVKTGYDRDGDRIEDNIDNCPDIENPVQDDADGDNIGNKCDNCLFDPNPYQEDSDGDNRTHQMPVSRTQMGTELETYVKQVQLLFLKTKTKQCSEYFQILFQAYLLLNP